MRKTILAPAILLLAGLTSCADLKTYKYYQTYAMVQPVESFNREHEDTDLAFRFEIKDKKIEAIISNKSDKEVKLFWSQVKYIDSYGGLHKIANRESLFSKKMEKTLDAVLSPGSVDENLIVPIDHVEELEEQWTWSIKPLFNMKDDRAILNRNKKFSIIFPVEVRGGERRKYKFDFMVANVIPHRSQTPM